MNYVNQKDCHLMMWETNQNKRNVNNEIKFNISEKTNVSIGDEIQCPLGMGKNSVYKITEVLDTKKSSISGMNYITAKTEWFIN